jgi:hypothetical protein
MRTTPEGIQKMCGIEPGAGRGRAIPRVLFAYLGKPREPSGPEALVRANPDKFNYLATRVVMIMTNALPEQGQKRKTTRPVSQSEMAAASGLKRRETMTRRISSFAPEVDSPRRKRSAGARVLIHRQRNFCEPNRYSEALPESNLVWRVHDRGTGRDLHTRYFSAQAAHDRAAELEREHNSRDRFEVVERMRDDRDCYHSPTLQQLLAEPETGQWWDADAAGGWANGSFKNIPRWLWDKRLMDPDEPTKRLGDIPRLVATYYACKGLLDTGEVQPMQEEVAAACGISPASVYRANKKLAKLGAGTVFRVVPQGGTKRPDGSWNPAKPTMILYLPLRTISHADAQAERERYGFHLAQLEMHGKDVNYYQVFERLLVQYEGSERSWRTFYRQLHADLLAAGMPAWAIGKLLLQPQPG